MVTSPSGLPAAGISGSRSTALSVSTSSPPPVVAAKPGAALKATTPAPIRPSASRRVGRGSVNERMVWAPGRYSSEGQRSGQRQVARQHIDRGCNNYHREMARAREDRCKSLRRRRPRRLCGQYERTLQVSGDYLYFGLLSVDAYETTLSLYNGFNGHIDPAPFFTGTAAPDVLRDESYIAGLLAQARALLRAKFNMK